MRRTFECNQFIIFDDVLLAHEFDELWQHFQFAPFRPVNPGTPHSPWHVGDDWPLMGALLDL